MRRIAAALALLGVLTASAAALARPTSSKRADLKVSDVSGVPDTAFPGKRFEFTVAVRNAGSRKARRTRLSAFLSRDASYDAGDIRLVGAPKVRRSSGIGRPRPCAASRSRRGRRPARTG
jgi:hypothetical protein